MIDSAYKNKKCIVTGGAGFIGQNLTNSLIKSGAQVVVIDRFTNQKKRDRVNPKAILINCDVRDQKLETKLPKGSYDYLFHFAAPSSTVLFNENLAESIDITVAGFLNTIKIAAKKNIRFVYPSTGSLYNGVQPPHTENVMLNWEAQNEYAKAKIIIEKIANAYGRASNALGLRILAGYGPGEMHKGKIQSVVFSFCLGMRNKIAPIVWGDGTQRRDFVFIDDIVNMALTLAHRCPEAVINVGTGVDYSFKEIIQIINSYLTTKIKPTYVPKPQIYLEKTCADTKLLRKYYKRDFTPITIGIQKTLDSFKE